MIFITTILAAIVGGSVGFCLGMTFPSGVKLERELVAIATTMGGAATGALIALRMCA